MFRCFVCALLLSSPALPVLGFELHVAQFHVELRGRGPGELLARIRREDSQTEAVAQIIAEAAPDVILLNAIDYDPDLKALSAMRARIKAHGHDMPYAFARPPNSGVLTGIDLDSNGRNTDPEDAHGWERFRYSGGMALLARYPLRLETDHSHQLWCDFPGRSENGANGVPLLTNAQCETLRLHPVGAWLVWVEHPDQHIMLGTMQVQTPAFDGPEDRNGFRGRDELQFWRDIVDALPDHTPFVLLGTANVDPYDGDGHHAALNALRTHSRLQDAEPGAPGGVFAADSDHLSPPDQDTVDWARPPGNLRVDYILPSHNFKVASALLDWPSPENARAELVQQASRHRLIRLNLELSPEFAQGLGSAGLGD